MDKVLFINACVRSGSRTKQLAAKLLERIGGEVSEADLPKLGLLPLTEATLEKREALIGKADYSDPMFCLAKDFADADTIVIAAPYWDLSFPSMLKVYFEHISVRGITFSFSKDGMPIGLSKAKTLWYVSTMGAKGLPYDFGFGYVKAISSIYYGIHDVRLVNAEGLDLYGNDPDAIISEAVSKL